MSLLPDSVSNVMAEEYQLANDDWKYDVIPEIMDGKNISDFIDPEIDELLEQLEREEDERIAALEEQLMDVDVRSLRACSTGNRLTTCRRRRLSSQRSRRPSLRWCRRRRH